METVGQLNGILDRVADEGGARVLLISGEGRSFCSGVELGDGDGDRPGSGMLLEKAFNPLIERLAAMPLPIVCSVKGAAAGAGCALALASDFVVAARSAYFLLAFVKIGLIPDMGTTWHLPRAIGGPRAIGMMMLGDRIPAEQAADWGMIWKVCDDDALDDEVEALAVRLAAGPTQAYRLIRQAMRSALNQSLSETLWTERINQRAAGLTADFVEGVAAFKDKRPAIFMGG
jgi:2-(1,2-epoxy-1,2-dihydrophenyl)acetyl-CoA isomerase